MVAVTVALACLAAGPAWAQCQMCKTALTNSAEGQRMVVSFNNAILMMVVAPYLVVGAIVVALMRQRIVARGAAMARTLLARLRSWSPATGTHQPR
jgi:hypothetical protein